MIKKLRENAKIIVVFAALFVTVITLLLLVMNAGKKTYTVTFDLDGGTLVSGELEQVVIMGQNAIPPEVSKEDYYLESWSASFEKVTQDIVVKAEWARPVTPGINYSDGSNYSTIASGYKYIQGEITLGSHNGSRVILGINDYAFANITGITKISLPEHILSIGGRAFSGCTALTEITIPEEVVSIGDSAFNGCIALETVELNEGLAGINPNTFEGCIALTEIEIPSTVIYIGSEAFYGCEALETLIIPEGVERIESGAFAGCKKLQTVILPQSLLEIGENAFEGCESLTIKTSYEEGETPEGWEQGWNGNANVEWGCVIETEESDS